jgi:hypothetical protein
MSSLEWDEDEEEWGSYWRASDSEWLQK